MTELYMVELTCQVSLTKPRSYERDRPLASPPLKMDLRETRPPSVPDVPPSPSTSTHVTSQSSSTDVENEHWATQVFRDISTTPLSVTGEMYVPSALTRWLRS